MVCKCPPDIRRSILWRKFSWATWRKLQLAGSYLSHCQSRLKFSCIWAWHFRLTSPNCKHKVCARISQAQMQRKFSCIWACEFQLEFCWVAIHAQMQLQLRWTFGIQTRDVKIRLNSHSSNAAEIHWIWACAFQPASEPLRVWVANFVELQSRLKISCIWADIWATCLSSIHQIANKTFAPTFELFVCVS